MVATLAKADFTPHFHQGGSQSFNIMLRSAQQMKS
jgi:hypothetical protein